MMPLPSLKQAGAHRVLLAEDDTEMRELLVDVLVADGFDVRAVATGAELAAAVSGGKYALIVSDNRLPAALGLDVLVALRDSGDRTPFILMTAFVDDETRGRAEPLSAALLEKPFDLKRFRDAVSALVAGEGAP
jgi:DNA-binding response OmpR family regulator